MKTLLLTLIAFAATTCLAQEQKLLNHSIVGSASCESQGPCYNHVMEPVAVQRFFLNLAKGPIEVSKTDAALQGTGVSVQDLLALRLIRREGDRYFLNFPLFTAGDVNLIRERSERYADSLADAMLARRGELDSALAAYDAPGVDRKAVVYFLLGCASLDWDGLEVTAKNHYRKTSEKRPDGDYVPAAEEKTEESLKGIYWGSHNWTTGEIGLTSFGDHFSPRFAFPDLLWTAPARVVARKDDPAGTQEALRDLTSATLQLAGPRAGNVMLSLRDGAKTPEEVAAATKLDPDDAKALLEALTALEYVAEKDGRYQALVPVLTGRDQATSDQIRKIGREVMERWLAANYGHMRSEMKDLSFTRSGVSFEDGFTMIWHYVFGITNRKLVERGLFADPYASDRRFKGSIPAVYSLKY
jgi:hypothetical protein